MTWKMGNSIQSTEAIQRNKQNGILLEKNRRLVDRMRNHNMPLTKLQKELREIMG